MKLATLITLLCLTPCFAQNTKFLTYDDAVKQAAQTDKILVVILTADYCGSCTTLKREVFQPLLDTELKDCLVAVVDIEKQPEIAVQLRKGSTIPETVFYIKDGTGWKSTREMGLFTRSRLLLRIKSLKQK